MSDTTWTDLVLDHFGRVDESLRASLDGLDEAALAWRPGPDANPLGWTVWHVSRVFDDHLAKLVDREQVWQGSREGVDAPYEVSAFGYGQSPDEVGRLRATAEGLLAYWGEVHERAREIVSGLAGDDPDRVVDENWDPPVTLAVRLVSLMDEGSQHAGQVAYVRGLWDRHAN